MEQMKSGIRNVLLRSISDDYISDILGLIIDGLIDDITTSTAFEDERYYSDDDIRLSFGRFLMQTLGIER